MIPHIKKILFTTDLSQGAREVFDVAVSLADAYQASITILFVIEETPSEGKRIVVDLIGEEAWEKIQTENEQYARNILIGKQKEAPIIKEALKKLSEEAQVSAESKDSSFGVDDIIVTSGKISEEIVQQAEAKDCDLIVMGYRVHSLITDAILGSKTRSVLKRFKKPVVLVPLTD